MDAHVSLFIDNFSVAQDLLDGSETENLFYAGPEQDVDDQDTPWQEFYGPVDAWARHALASNGFGGF